MEMPEEVARGTQDRANEARLCLSRFSKSGDTTIDYKRVANEVLDLAIFVGLAFWMSVRVA